jgi:hypothetical protein
VNKANQTITFGALPARTYGDAAFTVSATASSNLAVSFSVGATDNCTISGTAVTLTGAGSCSVTASQGGDNNYEVAPSVTQTFTIAKATPTVSLTWEDGTYTGNAFPASGSVNGVGTPAEAVSSPALGFTYYSGSTPTGSPLGGPPTNAGTYTVHASFTGNNNYEPASANKTITIEKATPDVVATGGTFVYDGSQHAGTGGATGVGGEALTPVALSYSGTINGGTSYGPTASAPTEAGSYSVTTSYAGSANYKSGTSIPATLAINRATPTITWTTPADIYFGTALSSAQLNAAATGVDGNSLPGTFAYSPAAGTTTLPVGNRTLSTLFTPTNGNNYTTASRSVSLNVLAWSLHGFYQPVDMNGVLNTVKNGSTVPLKFNVLAGPTELTDPNVVRQPLVGVFETSCSLTALQDDIELLSTGGTSLRYDPTGKQFILNWQTPKKAGACYRVVMTTQDGSSLSALFKLK